MPVVHTVSHHDPELTFNHSFIEPPSSNWVTDGSSFDSDEEKGEVLYCVPPREGRNRNMCPNVFERSCTAKLPVTPSCVSLIDIPAVAGGEFQEMSSKCNMFLDPSGFSSEDISSAFNIPRTSSNAKSKRPSVSFAEGTRFSPKERRGSGQDHGAVSRSKAKSPWGALMLSTLHSQGSTSRSGEEDGVEDDNREGGVDVQVTDNQESSCEADEQEANRTLSGATLQVSGPSGRRRTMSNTAGHKGARLPMSDVEGGESQRVTTVYVTVGKAGKPLTKTDSGSEGPVQAMLRRLGSLQRQREQESYKPKLKAVEGITKPPRRKLGARATVWEQGGPAEGEAVAFKPIRKKHTSQNTSDTSGIDSTPPPEGGTTKHPLSSILKNTSEVATAESGSDLGVEEDTSQDGDAGPGQTESSYLTVGPAGDTTEIIANQRAVGNVGDEPCYENVFIKQS